MWAKIANVKTPFGFSVVDLGSLRVYCGKLRIKGIKYVPSRAYINVKYHGPYCHISFEVIDKVLANQLAQELGKVAKEVAQAKIDNKWGWITIKC